MPFLPLPGFDLEATLDAGQTFAWERRADGSWQGFAGEHPCIVATRPGGIHVLHGPVDAVRAYFFHAGPEGERLLDALPSDPAVRQALDQCRGLRLIQDPWWPCTASFICSSLKPVPQIRQLHWKLRRAWAAPGADFPHLPFPSPTQVAEGGEALLRRLGLGFRARHLHAAACVLAEGRWDFSELAGLPTPEAARHLSRLPGVGDKIAHCILLYAGGRLDAFPLDVWMIRVMQRHYRRPGRRLSRPADLHRFAARHFGPLRGLAQLYLFHYARMEKIHCTGPNFLKLNSQALNPNPPE